MKNPFAAVLFALMLSPSAAMAEVQEYVCNFPSYHSADNEQISTSNGFVLKFTFDTVNNDAFLEGNGGISPVHLVKGIESMTFLEALQSGAVQSTTITSDGAAVHSRHTIISGALVPSQYYGICQ